MNSTVPTTIRIAAAALSAALLTSCGTVGLQQSGGSASASESSESSEIDRQAVIETSVVRVIDGDTIVVEPVDQQLPITDTGETTVRLLGIQAPEMNYRSSASPECGAQQATDTLDELLNPGTEITVSFDERSNTRDHYGRVLGYVETLDGQDAATSVLDAGWAQAWHPDSEPEPQRYSDYALHADGATQNDHGLSQDC